MHAVLYLLLITSFTFMLYAWDKAQAKRHGARVPEFVLLLAGFAGGTLGAILGQRMLRHKTKKLSFQLKFWGLTLVQLVLIATQPHEIMAVLQRII